MPLVPAPTGLPGPAAVSSASSSQPGWSPWLLRYQTPRVPKPARYHELDRLPCPLRRSAGRRAFSWNISITQCDAVCQLAGYPAGHGRSRPALNGRAHASAACASLFRRVHDSCDLAKQLRRIRQKHRSKAETETNK